MTFATDAKETFESMRDELLKLRDEVKLQIHLGSMDLKDRFEAIQPEVRAFEKRAEDLTAEVGAELKEGWQHIREALSRIKKELDA